MFTFVTILIAALVLIGLVVWLLAEINADRKWRKCSTCGRIHADNSPDRIGGYQPCPSPTVPGPLERLPPKSDI